LYLRVSRKLVFSKLLFIQTYKPRFYYRLSCLRTFFIVTIFSTQFPFVLNYMTSKNKRDLTSKIFSAGLALLFVLAFPIYRPTNGELPTHVTQVDFVVQTNALERYVPSRMIYHVH